MKNEKTTQYDQSSCYSKYLISTETHTRSYTIALYAQFRNVTAKIIGFNQNKVDSDQSNMINGKLVVLCRLDGSGNMRATAQIALWHCRLSYGIFALNKRADARTNVNIFYLIGPL